MGMARRIVSGWQKRACCALVPIRQTAVDFLEQFNPPYYKIALFEIQDIPLIEYTASKGRPMITLPVLLSWKILNWR